MTPLRWALLAAIVACVVAFFSLGLGHYVTLDALKSHAATIATYRDAHPWAAAGAYFALYVAVAALSLPGAAVMTLAGGAIFGLAWGTLLASFAASLGATLAFLAARYLLRDAVQHHFGGARLKSIDAGVARDGAFYLMTLRLIPLFPFFVINLGMGLTSIPVRTFYWASQLGMLPGTVIYVNAGRELASIDKLGDLLSPWLIGSLLLLAIFPLVASRLVAAYKSRRVTRAWPRPRTFDRNLVVIGAGSAGLVSAFIAATVKAKVTLVEKHKMGGDCLNTGCVPSKALIRSARLLADIGRARQLGIGNASASFDFADVMDRVHRIIHSIEPHDSVERYTALGVECIAGSARITSPYSVEVDTADGVRKLTTRSIVIAAGARPAVPDLPGIERTGFVTSDTLWSLRELPKRLLVLGGGPIGVELAQCFARFGASVTQVEKSSHVLAREDADVAEMVARNLREDGVDILTDCIAQRFVVEGDEKILIATQSGRQVRVAFDVLLCAVGRAPTTEGYGLETLGVPTSDKHVIEADEFLQTRFPNIYVCGDVVGPYQFTHMAAHQAWYATVNALFGGLRRFRVDYSVVPAATFTDPEIARVGLNEKEAIEQGIKYEVTRYDIGELDRAITDGAAQGVVKVLTVPGKDRILGATIVAEHAGELIAEFVSAMKHGIGLSKILGTIHIYPTLAEGNKYAAGVWKRAHTAPWMLRLAKRYHAWQLG